MFIPMHLNAPLVVGGLVAWFVSTRSKDEATNKARFDRGTLIASGFIAGGALMGVISAVLKFADVQGGLAAWAQSSDNGIAHWVLSAQQFLGEWTPSKGAEWTALVMYLVIIAYFAWHSLKAKAEKE